MRNYRLYNYTVISITVIGLGILGLINFIVDPLQFYRTPRYVPYYSDQQRYQNPGLAKNYDYDTIILGTSMTEGFLPSSVNKSLNCKTLKLSISGATIKEQNMIANLALRTGKVKNVIWGVDFYKLIYDDVNTEFGPFPFYLYDSNPINDFNYLLNYDTSTQSLMIIRSQLNPGIKPYNSDLEHLNNYNYSGFVFNREEVLKVVRKKLKEKSYDQHNYDFSKYKTNIDRNFLDVVRNSPHTNFYIFFPPYSIFYYKLNYEYNKSAFYFNEKIKKYIVDQLSPYDNVKIFDFQDVSDITFNSDNYKDTGHYNEKINDYIIESLKTGKHQLTSYNIEHRLANLRRQVSEFNLASALK